MKLAIMQPYFMPYIGYFQLINTVDKFVIYDNIEYTKKGWINRNRILVNDKSEYITLPVKKDSDYLSINQRFLADSFEDACTKILRKINNCYRNSPYYDNCLPLIEEIFSCRNLNLFEFILNSVLKICAYLDITTPIILSSNLNIDHRLKAEKKVISICKCLNCITYVNPIGGTELYSKEEFKKNKLNLFFLETQKIEYKQFNTDFVPWLSILDILMFNSKEETKSFLNNYRFK